MPWSRRRSVLVGVVAGLLIGTAAAIVIASTGDSAGKPDVVLDQPGAPSEPGTFPVAKDVKGTPLPDGTFEHLSGGGSARFADYRGTPLVINVWAAWCPPCQQEMPDFQRVHEALGDRVRFVGLDRADSRSAAQQFASERGITYDLLFDPDDTFAPEIGVAVMPTTLLVSPEGVVVKTLSGTVSADQLTAAIQEAFPA
jgi:cytochrome c biogenesis protein CcmG/thiol:disulfide interchange protein DsbE